MDTALLTDISFFIAASGGRHFWTAVRVPVGGKKRNRMMALLPSSPRLEMILLRSTQEMARELRSFPGGRETLRFGRATVMAPMLCN